MFRTSRWPVVLLGTALLGWGRHASGETDPFPAAARVLERRCVQCHQGDEPKGGRSFETADGLRDVVDDDAPDTSLLLEVVSGEKPRMPKAGAPLSRDEIEALRSWIRSGAPWPAGTKLRDRRFEGDAWWALQPLSHPPVPPAPPWARTPIDAFIADTLARNGLTPSPEADRRVLIRRLTYDLHGLPPTPAEIDDFLADDAPDAYERLVDRLLDSPRYGERWGRHWLDVVHYGDSHGYDKDKPRPHAWPYRDYVIDSFDRDLPYSRFVQEQLAGDVLFPDDPRGIVATGFIAAGPWDFVGHVELREGTADKDLTRSNDRDDMVAATMSTFLSLTVHCARCHDHKFDPISQKEYYRLQAVFAGVDRADRPYDPDPQHHRRRRELRAAAERLRAEQARIDAEIDRLTSPELDAARRRLADLERRKRELPPPAAGLPAATTLGYHSSIMPDPDRPKWVQVDLGEPRTIEKIVIFPAHVAYGGHPGPGFGFPPRFRVELADEAEFASPVVVADETGADFPFPGDQPVVVEARGRRARYVRITATKLWKRTDDWIFALSELAVLGAEGNLARGRPVEALDSIEAGSSWGRQYLVDGATSQSQIDSLLAVRSTTNGYHSAIEDRADVEKWVQVDLGRPRTVREIRLLPARPVDFPDTPGFGFPVRYKIEGSIDEDFRNPVPIVDRTSADVPNPGDAPVVAAGPQTPIRYVRVTATKLWERTNDFCFALAELQVDAADADGEAVRNAALGALVTARDTIDAGLWRLAHLTDGCTSRAATPDGIALRLRSSSSLDALMAAARREIDAQLAQLLPEELQRARAQLESDRQAHAAAWNALPPAASYVYAAANEFTSQGNFTPARTPRPVPLLHRGSVKQPGELMAPGTLACLAGLPAELQIADPADEGQRRAALALWLTDPRNALLRRSIVNRVWHYHFGRGIVDSPNDFGRMGALPTHPELLDWLAGWFQAEGESIKKLHKLIVTSAVYRQSSLDRPEAAAIDAGNRFLWRMNRRRLEAEAIRDAMLAVSGQLDLARGGPGQQQFVFKDDHSPVYDYERFDVDSPASRRRSVYRFIVRSVPDPFMETLDCPDASLLTPKRNATLTALQALTMFNNRFTVHQAEQLAARAARETDNPDVESQIGYAFRCALGRLPDPAEREGLASYARRHGLPNACRLILNMNEFVFID